MDHATLSALLPGFGLSQDASALRVPVNKVGAPQRQCMKTEGYFRLADALAEPAQLDQLRGGIVALVDAGWPASFIYVTDEAWRLAVDALGVLAVSPHHVLTGDFLAWHVAPGSAGFSPHRDRQPEALADSFADDGQPKYATVWVALTDVSSENSCLFVMPASHDPGYHGGDGVDDDAPSPLQVALPDKQSYQHIRALTGPAGSACT